MDTSTGVMIKNAVPYCLVWPSFKIQRLHRQRIVQLALYSPFYRKCAFREVPLDPTTTIKQLYEVADVCMGSSVVLFHVDRRSFQIVDVYYRNSDQLVPKDIEIFTCQSHAVPSSFQGSTSWTKIYPVSCTSGGQLCRVDVPLVIPSLPPGSDEAALSFTSRVCAPLRSRSCWDVTAVLGVEWTREGRIRITEILSAVVSGRNQEVALCFVSPEVGSVVRDSATHELLLISSVHAETTMLTFTVTQCKNNARRANVLLFDCCPVSESPQDWEKS